MCMAKQTQKFQAETKELLDLMIHSLYSHREIFLRELISNASDAIEKIKFESLTNPALAAIKGDFEIRLDANSELKTLSISDNGIGMTKEEVIQFIGTIAHSGTKAFLKMKQELKDQPGLIGQFGVGFYSAFMVADRVTLHTRKAGADAGVLWESDGSGTYSLDDLAKPEHGTTITLHLKDLSKEAKSGAASTEAGQDDAQVQDFTNPWTLKEIVRKYSDFVTTPVKMKTTREETKDGKSETVVEDETLNSQKALWLRPASEITPQEYNEFYRHISHDWTDPLKTIHYKAEGAFEFVSVLYIPSMKPFDYDYRDRKIGLGLYVKRVFIKSDCHELLPTYLRFVQGMVDSNDLTLNVSREILQQDRQIVRIKKALTSKVLSSLKELLENDRASYEKFWGNFGATLKEGIAFEPAQLDKLQELTLFYSTASEKLTTLREYVDRMKIEQKAIYYITGDHLQQIQNSPYLEKLKANGYEVLLMTDKVDAWVASSMKTYAEKPFQSVMGEDLDLSSEEEKAKEKENNAAAEARLKPLLDQMKETLIAQVKEIRLSDRLTDSPVCLVSSNNEATAHMERLMASMGQAAPKAKRILEINPDHPLYEKMMSVSKAQQEAWTEILFQQALLNEGSAIENPLQYSQKIAQLMMSAQ